MIHLGLIVAVLLMMLSPEVAAATEDPTRPDKDAKGQTVSQKAKKVVTILKSMGLADSGVAQFVYEVDSRVQDGYLNITQDTVGTGTMLQGHWALRYEMEGVRARNLQLSYRPDNTHVELLAQPNQVLLHYNLKF